MKAGIKKKYETQANILKALSHPTRLFIVEQLAEKELCVKDITKLVGVDISTISKHLSILKQAHILDMDKRGNSIFYRLKMKCVLNFFSCVNMVLEKGVCETRKVLG